MDGIVSEPSCVCLAVSNMCSHSGCCKHLGALLLSLYPLKNCKYLTVIPEIFMCPYMKRFAMASPFLQEKVEYCVNSTSYDIFQVDNRLKKKVWKSAPRPDYVGWACEKLQEKLREREENFFRQKDELAERREEVDWRKRERMNRGNTFYSLPSLSMTS